MAEYKVTYTADGKVKKELVYKETVFSYTMIPNEFGKTCDKKGFKYQVEVKFNDEKDYVLDSLDNLPFADDDEIEEILSLLEDRE